jgi:hypothetical protein
MKITSIIKFSFLLALLVLYSCETEDFTGYSTLEPTSPTISVSGIPGGGYNITESDQVFEFDVTLSTAQVVDVAVYITQISGTAAEGEDFVIMNDGGKLTFTAGATTGKVRIHVLPDDLQESTETFTIQIGDERTANAKITPVTVDYTLKNATSDALSVDMEWSTNVADVIGVDKAPEEVADMRLLIMDEDDNVIAVADGAAFENYSSFDTLDNGEYKIAFDFYSTMSFGDIDAPIDLSFMLSFNQAGVINGEVLDFPNIVNNVYTCEFYRTILATVTKNGATYTITKAPALWIDPAVTSADAMAGNWAGYDADAGYASEIVASVEGGKLMLLGIGRGWMQDAWGEVIITEDAVEAVYDPETGTYNIANQPIMTTTYEGDPQPAYFIEGSIAVDFCAGPDMIITYDFIQPEGAGGIAQYFGLSSFEAGVSLGGKKSASQATIKLNKPVR